MTFFYPVPHLASDQDESGSWREQPCGATKLFCFGGLIRFSKSLKWKKVEIRKIRGRFPSLVRRFLSLFVFPDSKENC